MKTLRINILKLILGSFELFYLFPILFFSFLSRFCFRRFDIGLGPIPMINNVYHKRALEAFGYKVETFVSKLFFITDKFDKKFVYENKILHSLLIRVLHIDYLYSVFNHRCLYLYFNGGCLQSSIILWRLEPFLLGIAGIKTVVMPYGGDISKMDRTPNLLYKHTLALDYPEYKFRNKRIECQIDLWSKYADHVIGGCDWVDYMHHWDTLMIAHFSIDLKQKKKNGFKYPKNGKRFRVLHAPNHRNIKGSSFVIKAIEELQKEGENIELKLLEKVSNDEVLKEIEKADLVIDQLVIGWYAMFTLEALSLGTPVVCYLRDDLLELYKNSKLLKECDPPIYSSKPREILSDLRSLMHDQKQLEELSNRGPKYVKENHSIEYVGTVFHEINSGIGLKPTGGKS